MTLWLSVCSMASASFSSSSTSCALSARVFWFTENNRSSSAGKERRRKYTTEVNLWSDMESVRFTIHFIWFNNIYVFNTIHLTAIWLNFLRNIRKVFLLMEITLMSSFLTITLTETHYKVHWIIQLSSPASSSLKHMCIAEVLIRWAPTGQHFWA